MKYFLILCYLHPCLLPRGGPEGQGGRGWRSLCCKEQNPASTLCSLVALSTWTETQNMKTARLRGVHRAKYQADLWGQHQNDAQGSRSAPSPSSTRATASSGRCGVCAGQGSLPQMPSIPFAPVTHVTSWRYPPPLCLPAVRSRRGVSACRRSPETGRSAQAAKLCCFNLRRQEARSDWRFKYRQNKLNADCVSQPLLRSVPAGTLCSSGLVPFGFLAGELESVQLFKLPQL